MDRLRATFWPRQWGLAFGLGALATQGDRGVIQLDEPVVLNSAAEAPGTGAAFLQSKTPPVAPGHA